jgi:hypothetical protein
MPVKSCSEMAEGVARSGSRAVLQSGGSWRSCHAHPGDFDLSHGCTTKLIQKIVEALRCG